MEPDSRGAGLGQGVLMFDELGCELLEICSPC